MPRNPAHKAQLLAQERNGRPGTWRRAETEANHFASSLCGPLAAVSVETGARRGAGTSVFSLEVLLGTRHKLRHTQRWAHREAMVATHSRGRGALRRTRITHRVADLHWMCDDEQAGCDVVRAPLPPKTHIAIASKLYCSVPRRAVLAPHLRAFSSLNEWE